MNTLPSPTKSLHFLNPATITFVNFAVSAHISTSKQPAPLPPPMSILNLIAVTLSIITFQTINLTGSNRSRTLLLVLLLKLLNPHIIITPILKSLHWLKVNEHIEYKLLSLTYKVLTTSQPSYLDNLISVQPPRSTRSSSVVTLSRPPTISSLKITDRSFRYASPRFGINFQIHSVSLTILVLIHLLIHFSTHLCSLSSSPLSSSITPSLFHFKLKTYFKQILPPLDFFYLLDCLTITGPDWTYYAHHFIFSFTF